MEMLTQVPIVINSSVCLTSGPQPHETSGLHEKEDKEKVRANTQPLSTQTLCI